MKHLRVLLLPPGRDASPSQGYLPAVCRRYPFIHLGEKRQSGVKFLFWGNNVMGEAWTPDLQIRSSRCQPRPHTPPHVASFLCRRFFLARHARSEWRNLKSRSKSNKTFDEHIRQFLGSFTLCSLKKKTLKNVQKKCVARALLLLLLFC